MRARFFSAPPTSQPQRAIGGGGAIRRRVVMPVAALLAWIACFDVALAQNVWRVHKNPSSGADFDQVQPAIDAASDGDVIVIETAAGPDYAGFRLKGKSLTLIGKPLVIGSLGGLILFPGIQGRVIVSDIAAHQSVTVRGMRIVTIDSLGPVLSFEHCEGPIFLETIEVEGFAFDDNLGAQHPQLLLRRCAAVHVSGARVGPGTTIGQGQLPFRGAEFEGSNVAWSGGWIQGGESVQGFKIGSLLVPGLDGAEALRVAGGRTLLSGVQVAGGKGGKGFIDTAGTCFPSGSGGVGLRATHGAQIHSESALISGGPGAAAVSASCAAGIAGETVVLLGAQFVDLAAGPRFARTTSPANLGESHPIRVAAEPFDFALLMVATELAGMPLDGVAGVLALVDPVPFAFIQVGAGGTADLNGGMGLQPAPGAAAVRLYVQALVWNGSGADPRFSAPSALVLLAP